MNGEFFVLGIIALSMASGIFSMWIKARHGYPIEDRHSRRAARMRARYGIGTEPATERRVQLLAGENERLTGQISRLEERIAVLERIATDPAERISRQIDALR